MTMTLKDHCNGVQLQLIAMKKYQGHKYLNRYDII